MVATRFRRWRERDLQSHVLTIAQRACCARDKRGAYPGLFTSLLTVGVMLMVIESYGYLAQNTAQTQRDRTTQRREERKERNSALQTFKAGAPCAKFS